MMEIILAMGLFLLIFSLLLPLMTSITRERGESVEDCMAWELFLQQAKKEMRSSDWMKVSAKKVYLLKGERTVTYEPYQNMLRRQVNREGHEILLFGVENIFFEKISHGISIQAKIHGQPFAAEILLPTHIVIE
jgi:hypothetical protein